MQVQDPQVVIALIGLGANLDDPKEQLARAFQDISRIPDTRLLRRSSLYSSAPVGKHDQPDFTNAAAMVETRLSARALLEALLGIEQRHGRVRREANGPRTLDLDLLLFGDRIITEPGLSVPHPRMHQRRFVLDPLLEIDPGCSIPGRGPARDALALVLNQSVRREGKWEDKLP